MVVDVFQHVPFEDLGAIRAWLDERGLRTRYTRFFAHEAPPPADDVEALIVLGGPMSVNDEDALPWLVAEKQCLRDAVARGLPVLGICLGAQLLASALGARVYPQGFREIGWFPIRRVPGSDAGTSSTGSSTGAGIDIGDGAAADAAEDAAIAGGASASFEFPADLMVFHWHGDTFDLPEGAVLLAESDACRNQAFQIADRIIGVQCHLEMTPDSVEAMIAHGRDELTPAAFVQTDEQLRKTPASTYRLADATLHALLAHVFTPA